MLLLVLFTSAAAAADQPPHQLLVDLLPSPALGIEPSSPTRFGWALLSSPTARGVAQTAYQIVVTSEADAKLVWDSGKVSSNSRSAHVPYGGIALKPASAYSWTVQWWSNASSSGAPSSPSAAATFVTGLGMADWRDANFLNCGPKKAPPVPPPPPGMPFWPVRDQPTCRHLRREFTSSAKVVRRATAFVTALGYVELRLNGQKAGGSAVLEPAWTQVRSSPCSPPLLLLAHLLAHLLARLLHSSTGGWCTPPTT